MLQSTAATQVLQQIPPLCLIIPVPLALNYYISDCEGHMSPLNGTLKDFKMTPGCLETTYSYVALEAVEPGSVTNSGGLNVIYSCKCFIFNSASRWMKRFIDDPEAPSQRQDEYEGLGKFLLINETVSNHVRRIVQPEK